MHDQPRSQTSRLSMRGAVRSLKGTCLYYRVLTQMSCPTISRLPRGWVMATAQQPTTLTRAPASRCVCYMTCISIFVSAEFYTCSVLALGTRQQHMTPLVKD